MKIQLTPCAQRHSVSKQVEVVDEWKHCMEFKKVSKQKGFSRRNNGELSPENQKGVPSQD